MRDGIFEKGDYVVVVVDTAQAPKGTLCRVYHVDVTNECQYSVDMISKSGCGISGRFSEEELKITRRRS
jgi:hypothetical protein